MPERRAANTRNKNVTEAVAVNASEADLPSPGASAGRPESTYLGC